MNFSTDGGGLANWWSILTRILEPEDYQIDGIIFAVIESDLGRRFTIAEHRGYDRHMFGRVPSWDPADWPQTLEEARPYLEPLAGYILSSQDYEKALRGDWQPELKRSWHPRVATKAMNLAGRAHARFFRIYGPESEVFGPGQLKLIEQLARFAEARSIPTLVIRIPTRLSLLVDLPLSKHIVKFSSLLDATFVEGHDAFAGLSNAEIRAHWFPYDGHWALRGSDRFAEFMMGVLDGWTGDFVREGDEAQAPSDAPQ